MPDHKILITEYMYVTFLIEKEQYRGMLYNATKCTLHDLAAKGTPFVFNRSSGIEIVLTREVWGWYKMRQSWC